jgi:hypothetical protein
MSWVITPTYDGLVSDADATAYLAAVQAADGQLLEPAVRIAVNNFIVGCKADGIWPAIKASCILAGARTLTGALVPLSGTAPTNNNFVAGDYNRKTGLKGNASNKWLTTASIYSSNVPDKHAYAYCSEATTGGGYTTILATQMNGGEILKNDSTSSFLMRPWGGDTARSLTNGIGGLGIARNNSANGIQYTSTASANTVTAAFVETALVLNVFARTTTGTEATNPRIPFFSGGNFLNLALLDARVTTLVNAFAAAIP